MTVDQVVAKFIQLRDIKKSTEDRHKAELSDIVEAMEKLEAWLLGKLQETGVESMKTSEGTAFVTTKTGAKVGDWSALLTHVRENNAWDLLTQGVSKTVVADYKKEHNDLPPGVSWYEEKVVQIRRS